MGGGDNDQYNDTSKNENLKPKKDCLGFISIPGQQFQSTTVCTKCPHCQHVGATKATATWSLKSYLCCYCCGCYWSGWQLLKGKDWIPKDCKHDCASCGEEIYHYKSCDVDVKDNEEKK